MRLFLETAILILFGVSAAPATNQSTSEEALNRLLAENPLLQVYEEENRVVRLYGAPVSSGADAISSAERFRLEHSVALGVAPDNLRPLSPEDGRSQLQPLMFDRNTGRYKFTLVTYSQFLDDLPVFRSELRILVRNQQNFPAVLLASELKDLGDFRIDPLSAGIDAYRFAAAFSDPEFPDLTNINVAEKLIWAGVDDMRVEPRLAVKIVADNGSPVTARWLYIVDIATDEVLYKENRLIDVDITGNVAGKATDGTGAEHCENEVIKALIDALVAIPGSDSAYSGANGDFVIPHAGSDPVTVYSWLRGQWFVVHNVAGSDAELMQAVTPPGPAFFVHNALNDEFTRAQVNAYVQADRIRKLVIEQNPAYPAMQQNEFPIYVNRTDGYCPGNAWYDPEDGSMNFCLAAGGYPNTAWSSVIHHEYGHHLVEVAGSGQGQYGEGMGDCMSILLADESGVGFGFYGDCSTPLREADNTLQYPCSGEIHYCGQLLSGCIWSLRNELAAIYPETYRDSLANLTVNSILLHTGSNITPAITIDFLTLDDDDGNINNGTPNYDAICAAFAAHNMDCPALQQLAFAYPDGRPEIVDPLTETSFRVLISGVAGEPSAGTGEFHYSIDGAPFVAGTIEELSPNEYEVTLPAASCLHRLSWYVSVQTSELETINDPLDAPGNSYSTLVATESAITLTDDFETDQGWTVNNWGGLTDGAWQRGVPVGGGDRGDPPTDYDGSGSCYLTDNVDGNSDVDNGTTSLVSPSLDVAVGMTQVSYARWYSNNAGDSPYSDVMEVFISNNDGVDWVLVETVGPQEQASGGWFEHSFWVDDFVEPTAAVRLRFDASDRGAGSVVEAGVDSVLVRLFTCENPYLCGDADGNEIVNVSDAVFLITYIFGGGAAPEPLAAGDVDCNEIVNISDAVYLISYIFAGGPEPCQDCR